MKFIHLVGDVLVSYLKLKLKNNDNSQQDESINNGKLLIYELFSNAVRHSPGKKLDILLYFQLDLLAIDIETTGPYFTIRPKDRGGVAFDCPYPDAVIGKTFPVYKDEEVSVVCHVLNDSCLEFKKQQTEKLDDFDIDVPEHFGLLLITGLSDDVKYVRTRSGRNIFSIRKNYPHESIR